MKRFTNHIERSVVDLVVALIVGLAFCVAFLYGFARQALRAISSGMDNHR